MPVTVTSLLEHPGFTLTAVTRGAGDALDREVAWAHSSDLRDPTPWLESGGLLLTDGVGFLEQADAAEVAEYVDRLTGAGVLALGFAVGIAHEAIPATLVEACDRAGLPLLEVPETTPFMGIIRHVSDEHAREEHERLERSLAALRAVARAALRPDGLSAILAELAQRLGTWVVLYDQGGAPARAGGRAEPPAEHAAEAEEQARRLLERGVPAAVRLGSGDGAPTLQTIGRGGRLRGVLAVGSADTLDTAGNDLVSSVIALASIALEQSAALESARRRLRGGILELLVAGVVDVADSTAEALWGRLPVPPLRVMTAATPAEDDPVLEELEVVAERVGGRLFFATREGELVVLVGERDEHLAAPVLTSPRLSVGVSGSVGSGEVSRGLEEARRASSRATAGRPARFDDLAAAGLLTYLETVGGREVAERLLAPLLEAPGGTDLLRAAAVWLRHLGQWDPAARELGIHRQTLRARIASAGDALGLDLDTVDARTELWAALSAMRLTAPSR